MKHNRKVIYLAGFLFSIPIALTSYVNSSFLSEFLTEYEIATAYAIASLITIAGLLLMAKILTRLGNRKTAILASTISLVSFLTLGLTQNVSLAVIAFILYFASFNFVFFCLDIFIEDFSKNTETGGIRGMYLSITSVSWVLAQMISGSVIAKSSLRGTYLLSALFVGLILLMLNMSLRNFKDTTYKQIPIWKNIKLCFKNRDISKIYLINLILKFFYAWMVIYTPIYLHEYVGFDWSQIGIIFSIMLIPFVLIEFPLGKLSDKIGEKTMLILGFVIIGIFTLIIPFLGAPVLLLWALTLFMTRVGAATIEVMSESYFFKLMDEKDAEIIGFFRNTTPLSYIIAPLFAIPVLYFTPSFKYLFFVLGVVLLCGLFMTFRLRDVK